MLDVAVQAGAGWPEATDWAALGERAVRAALSVSAQGHLIAAPFSVEVAVKLTDDAEVQSLNAAYRQKNKPTNVLSFPLAQPDLLTGLTDIEDGEALLGDIVLALETCTAEAAEKGVSLAEHATHLIAHGALHLVGLDHGDDAEAAHMEELEAKALATLGLSDPYSHD